MRRPGTVLLASELGAGTGHVRSLMQIGRRLAAAGHAIVAVTPHGSQLEAFAEFSLTGIAAPPWPMRTQEDWRASGTRSTTLADALAWRGLDQPADIAAALSGWVALLDEHIPDLVVTDYAPLCALAARDCYPVIQTGIGYCLPPVIEGSLPWLHQARPPVLSDDKVAGLVNEALSKARLRPIERFTDLFDGDALGVTTFPLFDPYARLREEPAIGPLLERLPVRRHAGADRIFAYLPADLLARPDVDAALRPLGKDLHLYSADSDESWKAAMARTGATIYDAAPPLAHLLAGCRLVIHQGGAGLAAEALLAGVPQLILSRHAEQDMNAKALEAEGAGRRVPLFEPGRQLDAEDLTPSSAMDDAAHALAEHHIPLMRPDPLDRLEGLCRDLLTSQLQ